MAATVAGTIGLAGLGGRLIEGYLLDRFNPLIVGGIAFSIPRIAALIAWNFDGSLWLATLLAISIGFALGSENNRSAKINTG